MAGHRCFNSTLVRLKDPPGAGVTWTFKVRKKFQFHSGAIKGNIGAGACAGLPMFQFHSGAIKGDALQQANLNNATFQFHSGAIKGRDLRSLIASLVEGFNSTLVRLKDGDRERTPEALLRFNSTLVRLKGCRPSHTPSRASLFQFHSGAIKGLAIPCAPSLIERDVSIPLWCD